MSNARRPDAIKKLTGTDQPCRAAKNVIEFEIIKTTPPHPSWMTNSHAIKEWERLTAILTNIGLLTDAGLTPLAHLCALHGEIVDMYEQGEPPQAALMATLRGLIADFGLTPVAQSKVGVITDKKRKTNPFAALDARKKA